MAESDFSEVNQLIIDLGQVPANAGRNIIAAVTVTSFKIKKAWQEPLKGSSSLPALPYALSYDVVSDGRKVEAEIGFDKGRNQGPLGNISEFGSPTITGRGFGLKALADNQSDFEKGLDIAIEQAERQAGF